MNTSRRHFLHSVAGCTVAALLPYPHQGMAVNQTRFGNGDLIALSDGNLSLRSDMILPNTINATEKEAFLLANNLNVDRFEPHCNLALWRTENRLVLFDVGAGPHFMASAGKVLEDLQSIGIDPVDITDVIFTHAHPDHLWGLVDDFDELVFPEASYYMNAVEWDYWRDANTINKLPELIKSFAVGARNRFPYIEERITLFNYGDEVVSGIEAVDTRGHTPGHTSFALHQGTNSMLVLGDAITHPIISFQKANWPSRSDQDPDAGVATRLSLLDRLAQDKMLILGYHLPHPGLGTAERDGTLYRYIAS